MPHFCYNERYINTIMEGDHEMAKKIISLLLGLVMLGCTFASAMFFDDSPRYIQVGRSDITSSYLDVNSIQSVRYDPPYYIIRATIVTYDYSRNTTTGLENNFFYNFNAQTVKAQLISSCAYDDAGNPTGQQAYTGQEVNACDRHSVNGTAADKAFFNCYSMTFYQNFSTKG